MSLEMSPELILISRALGLALVLLGLEAVSKHGFGLSAARRHRPAQRSLVVRLSAIKAPPVRLERATVNTVQTGTAQPTMTLVRLEPLSQEPIHQVTEKRAA